MTRYLDLAEYLWLAEQVTGTEAAGVAKSSSTDLANSALHAPDATRGRGGCVVAGCARPDCGFLAAAGRWPAPARPAITSVAVCGDRPRVSQALVDVVATSGLGRVGTPLREPGDLAGSGAV